jgi:hypothetical protein
LFTAPLLDALALFALLNSSVAQFVGRSRCGARQLADHERCR